MGVSDYLTREAPATIWNYFDRDHEELTVDGLRVLLHDLVDSYCAESHFELFDPLEVKPYVDDLSEVCKLRDTQIYTP